MEITWTYLFFAMLFFVVAFLYSSVGHGGASGYLMVMTFLGFAPGVSKISALSLNIIVSGVAFYHYYKSGYFKMKFFIPFAIGSVPASFIGALIYLNTHTYRIVLGWLLLISAVSLILFVNKKSAITRIPSVWFSLAIGAAIGLFSGMIGIGGGILLSPLILLCGWADAKETAATSALFIFVNSIAGIISGLSTGIKIPALVLPLLIIAVLGGFTGSYLGSRKLNHTVIRRLLGLVLLIASIKLING